MEQRLVWLRLIRWLNSMPFSRRCQCSLIFPRQLIRHNVLHRFEVVFLSDEDYVAVIDHLSDLGIVGGATYDAVILHAAAKARADQVVTLNERLSQDIP